MDGDAASFQKRELMWKYRYEVRNTALWRFEPEVYPSRGGPGRPNTVPWQLRVKVGSPAARQQGNGDSRLSWPGAKGVTIQELERRLRVRDLAPLTASFLLDEASADDLADLAAANAALQGTVLEMHRLRTAEGHWAYANCLVHGRAHHDDVAVRGTADAVWHGRLVLMARFTLPTGRVVDAVLVRWYEAAPAVLTVPSDPSKLEHAQRTSVALARACPRLVMAFKMNWCSLESIRRRVAVVPDFAASPRPPADGSITVGTVVYVNGFMSMIHGAGVSV